MDTAAEKTAAAIGITASTTPASVSRYTSFDFGRFDAMTRQLDLDLIAQARALAAAPKTTAGLRRVIAAMPAHAGIATVPDDNVWAYAFGVSADLMRRLADLAEKRDA